MENRHAADLITRDLRSRLHWRSILLFGATAGLVLVAYRALWLDSTSLDVDTLVFLPGRLPATLVVGVALWMIWRRRKYLSVGSAPETSGSQASPQRSPLALTPALGLALGLLGSCLFVWSMLTGKSDLTLPSLSAHAMAVAVAVWGRAGLRATILPALVLLMGLRIPKPFEDEIVWQLQVWTARWSGRLLEALDRDFIQSGVILRNDEHVFHVIDSCSGLNGILILTLIALIVREIFRDSDRHRLWLLVAVAPPLAFVLNIFRVAYVAASPNPEKLAGIEGDHTLQGLAVLMMGTVVLYGLGWALAARPTGAGAKGLGGEYGGARYPVRSAARVTATIAIPWLASLIAISWLLPRFPAPDFQARGVKVVIPQEKEGWIGEPAPHDLFFTGTFTGGVHRRYQLEGRPGASPQIVDLLIGFEDITRPNSTRLVSSKAALPGPEWQLEHERDARVWPLDRDARLALSSRRPGGEHALLYHWRIRDAGLFLETFRSLLALDVSPFRRPRPRGLVQIVAYAPHDGQLVVDRTKQRLDRFIKVFRKELGNPTE